MAHIFTLLAGLGVFLFGVKELSDNMEKLANRRLKTLFRKSSKNPLVGVGIGALTTAIVQSSGLTTVMVIGFVNAGLMTLYQATAFIMGANIGTTITAQIAALDSFSITDYAIALVLFGMIISMAARKEKIKSLGYAVAGLGMIFVGLSLMTGSMESLKNDYEPTVNRLFSSVSNPFLLLLLGAAATALMQSSAAVTSILIAIAGSGVIIGNGGNSVLFIVLGSNIGSCVTSIISSFGANTEAKRAGLIHLMFNVFGCVIFFVLLVCWKDFMAVTFERWFASPEQQIAMFHTFFNIVCTALFLPLTKVFVALAGALVRDGKKSDGSFIDDRFLSAPTVAIDQANKETVRIADIAYNAMKEGFEGFVSKRTDDFEEITKKCSEVNELSKSLTEYLIRVSSHDLTVNDQKRISILHSNNSDVVRLAEIADNFIKYTARAVREELSFSPGVLESLQEMFASFSRLYELTRRARTEKDMKILPEVDAEEDRLDEYRRILVAGHIDRLNRGECTAASSGVFINLVSNIERAGDHLSFIAHTIEEVAMA